MTTEHDTVQLRQYVLGASAIDEADAIEHDYFERADVLDQLKAAEDELIDDYLSARLSQTEREQFERRYLATPNHRRRVAVMRAITTAAASRQPSTPVAASSSQAWRALPIAASVLMLVGAGLWFLGPQPSDRDPGAVQSPPAPAAPSASPAPDARESAPRPPADLSRTSPAPGPSSPPVVVAVSLSPVLVRGGDEQATITIGTNIDLVRLHLRGLAGEQPSPGRAVVRTVAGREVWRGSVSPLSGATQQALARVDVPAGTLRPDDYIIELVGTDAGGRDVERHRNFLRVQTP